MAPTRDEFLEWLKEREPETELHPYQVALAEYFIEYNNKVFSGGLRSGRTFVLERVKDYYREKYPMVREQI